MPRGWCDNCAPRLAAMLGDSEPGTHPGLRQLVGSALDKWAREPALPCRIPSLPGFSDTSKRRHWFSNTSSGYPLLLFASTLPYVASHPANRWFPTGASMPPLQGWLGHPTRATNPERWRRLQRGFPDGRMRLSPVAPAVGAYRGLAAPRCTSPSPSKHWSKGNRSA